MRVNTDNIPAKIKAECAKIGKTWAAQEFDLAQDEGIKRCNWTRGEYCGKHPGEREACEQLIDDAAVAVWEALWNANPPARAAIEPPPR